MKNGKLVSLITLTMANVIGLSLVTLAWFTATQKAESGAGSIAVIKDDIVESIKYYPFDSTKTGTKTQYYFSSTETDSRSLGYYSIINSGYQMLVEVTLNKVMDVSVTAVTKATSYLGVIEVDEENKPIYSLHEKGNSLTSIVCFYGFNGDQVSLDDGSYFVDLSSSVGGKKNLINSTYTDLIDGKKNKICQYSNTDKIYLVVDYDEKSIETIYSANLGNEVTSGMGQDMTIVDGHSYISYDADFSFYISKVEETNNG